MIIERIASGPVADHGVVGSQLTVAGFAIDLADRQSDVVTTIDLTVDQVGVVQEGLAGRYVASVMLPPRAYQIVDSSELDSDGNPLQVRQLQPINMDTVKLVLWPIQ